MPEVKIAGSDLLANVTNVAMEIIERIFIAEPREPIVIDDNGAKWKVTIERVENTG